MSKHLKRRSFLRHSALASLAVPFLGACSGQKDEAESAPPLSPAEVDRFSDELLKLRQMPRELVMKLADQKVDQYMQQSHHCAQSSFLALKDLLGLKGEDVAKALTPLPGIAERGETCGAVSGPLMAMGLIYGRSMHQLDNWDLYQQSLVPAGDFCARFEEAFGTTLCHEVQQGKFGRCYRLTDPGELQEFQNDGATEKCSEVVRQAVRLAAGIILDDPALS